MEKVVVQKMKFKAKNLKN